MSSPLRSTTSSSRAARATRRCLAALACLLCTTAQALDVAVVVRKDSPVKQLSADEVYAIFIQDRRQGLVTYDVPDSDPARESFYLRVAGKTLTMMRGMRARLVFSGQARPPKQLPRDEVIQRLLADPNAIAYLPLNEVPPGLRIVLPLPDIP
ncbi:hypothetical protein OPU71_07710 [Niveibacterium sp. 24ML]|uniref:hypothetical protein n=1 Tax=Niveibacterium sp. 24ML TaxID=2985512 RepID=UPI00226DD3D1|nr:hypothetical protein [Niveibacterium sp. 24ML]MCX9156011.1 hypothetical protein [Niveibacterium sp. 24ML]